MTFQAFDPRKNIMQKIGTSKYNFNSKIDDYVIDVMHNSRIFSIPMYYGEKIRSGELPNLPYLSMKLVKVLNDPHDIRAATRKFTAYIDLDIVYVINENIDVVDFGLAIKNKLHDLIRINQEITTGIYFYNIDSEISIEEKSPSNQVIFHYILTIKCIYYDAC
jgi:hypothetical protein